MRISDWSSDVCSSDLVQDVASMMASLCGNTTVIGEAYNVAGAELTSVEGSIRLMAKAVGVEPDIVHVPMELARRARQPLLHWGKAIVGGATFSTDQAQLGRPSCRERVGPSGWITVVGGALKKKI